jgi:putative component of membrane protein insertase Oxa1/YidC/SpoIIIJ protein YidD
MFNRALPLHRIIRNLKSFVDDRERFPRSCRSLMHRGGLVWNGFQRTITFFRMYSCFSFSACAFSPACASLEYGALKSSSASCTPTGRRVWRLIDEHVAIPPPEEGGHPVEKAARLPARAGVETESIGRE